jgi:hypothetical protein
MVKRLPREVSDHNPLIISTGVCKPAKFIQFKFDLNWLSNPAFLVEVEKIWNKPCRARTTLDKILQKLKLLKQYFKGWGFNLQGELRKKKASISDELTDLENIEENVGLNTEQAHRKTWLIKEFLQLLDQEEAYWYARCHEQ